MKYLQKTFSFPKALAILGIFIILAAVFVKIPSAFALNMADILNAPKVLGDSAFIYPTASLVNDKGTIYFISDTTKVPFTSMKAFTGLGYSLKNVAKGDLSSYTPSQSYVIGTANMEHPWGSWISYKGVVYYSSQDGYIGVPSGEVFLSNGGKWNLVIKANKYDIAVLNSKGGLPVLTGSDSRISGQPSLLFGGFGSQNNSANSNPNPSPSPSAPASTTPATTTPVSFVPNVTFPDILYASSTASFIASSADPNTPLIYNFFWGDGTDSNSVTANAVTHTYYRPGVYMFQLSLTDSLEKTYTTSTPLTIVLPPNRTPSVPQFTLPTNIIVGALVTVTASASDPKNLPLSYTFSWGDGSPDTLAADNTATHTYSSSNTFTVKVTATNTQGFFSSGSAYFYVAP